jgi:hypothetical protein
MKAHFERHLGQIAYPADKCCPVCASISGSSIRDHVIGELILSKIFTILAKINMQRISLNPPLKERV